MTIAVDLGRKATKQTKHCYQSENDTFRTVYIQNMVTFSTVTFYFHNVSLKSFLLMALAFYNKNNCLNSIARLITIRSMYIC